MKKQPAGMLLADQIETEVRAGKHRPGAVLGFEPELIARYEVGRSVVRQAILLLEQRGIAFSRRGKGGGLVVAEPEPTSALRALSIVIGSQLADFNDIAALVSATDNHQFLNCTARIESETCEQLQTLVSEVEAMSDDDFVGAHGHGRVITAISQAFRDPAAALAQRTAIDYGTDLVPYAFFAAESRRRGEFWDLTRQLVDALISGDAARLFDLRMQQWRMASTQLTPFGELDTTQPPPGKIDENPAAIESQSSAERLSREILREIRKLRWKAGERIGGTEELLARYGASPNVLRQAVCILEEYSAVEMQRGRAGGLLIAAPKEEVAIQRALSYLRWTNADPDDAEKFLVQLALTAVDRSAHTMIRLSLPDLRAAIDKARAPDANHYQSRHDIYAAISQLAGCPTLRIFIRLLLRYLTEHSDSRPPHHPDRAAPLDELFNSILTGNTAKARRALIQYANLNGGPSETKNPAGRKR